MRPLSIFNRNRSVPALRESAGVDPFFRLQHEMNRLFDDAFSGFGLTTALRDVEADFRAPRLDVHETDAALEIEAELPGVEEKDVDVELADNLLTIRGEKRHDREEKRNGETRIAERSYGAFVRSLSLPFDVDPDAVEATFRNGVLKLVLPKPKDAARETRKIAIRNG